MPRQTSKLSVRLLFYNLSRKLMEVNYTNLWVYSEVGIHEISITKVST